MRSAEEQEFVDYVQRKRMLAAVRDEALTICGGHTCDRTLLVAMAMHAHICNINPAEREIPPRWRKWLAMESVKEADAVLAAMGGRK